MRDKPCVLQGHSAVLFNQSILIFGGYGYFVGQVLSCSELVPQHRSSFAEALRDRDNSYMDSYDITIIPNHSPCWVPIFRSFGSNIPWRQGERFNDLWIWSIEALVPGNTIPTWSRLSVNARICITISDHQMLLAKITKHCFGVMYVYI